MGAVSRRAPLFALMFLAVSSTAGAARADDEHGVTTPADASRDEPSGDDVGTPVTVLVSDFTVTGATGLDGDSAREVVASRLRRLEGTLVVRSLGEVQSSLDKAALAQLLGGDADDDLAGVARYVEVDRVVTGRVVEVGGVIDISLRLFHVTDGVMELALSRRVKADVDRSLVLTALESLADHLMAYVIRAYTDGAPSAAFERLRDKKIALKKPKAREPTVVERAPARGIGTPIGALLVGAGAGALAVGGLLVPVDEDATFGTNLGIVGAVAIPASAFALGALMIGVGGTMLVVDGLE